MLRNNSCIDTNAVGAYGRNRAAVNNNISVTCASQEAVVRVIKGSGTFNSTGVIPDGYTTTPINEQTEVEFSIDIYKRDDTYQGELYMVCYDTRKKISSNELIYFNQQDKEQAICIFCVQNLNGCLACDYELMVSMSPTSCVGDSTAKFYAYSAPIYNDGINMGGELRTGEILFADSRKDCYSC